MTGMIKSLINEFRATDRFTKVTTTAILAIVTGVFVYNYAPGSRKTLNPAGTTMTHTLPADYAKTINVSSAGSEGDLMLTYCTNDGRLVTQEYNRAGLWETTINWQAHPGSDISNLCR